MPRRPACFTSTADGKFVGSSKLDTRFAPDVIFAVVVTSWLQVIAALESLSEKESEVLAFEAKLEADGKASLGEEGFEIVKGMCSWTKGSKKVSETKYTPSVIEPSFGERAPRKLADSGPGGRARGGLIPKSWDRKGGIRYGWYGCVVLPLVRHDVGCVSYTRGW